MALTAEVINGQVLLLRQSGIGGDWRTAVRETLQEVLPLRHPAVYFGQGFVGDKKMKVPLCDKCHANTDTPSLWLAAAAIMIDIVLCEMFPLVFLPITGVTVLGIVCWWFIWRPRHKKRAAKREAFRRNRERLIRNADLEHKRILEGDRRGFLGPIRRLKVLRAWGSG